jgi:transcriptional regulator with XRE-family HTH domain
MFFRMERTIKSPTTLTERCKSSPFTRIEIAKRVGVSVVTLWRWERGDPIEKVDQIVALAVVFRCNPSDINPQLRDA